MLTIFGAKGGSNVFWCVFNLVGFKPSGITASNFEVVGPVTMKLPPNDGLWRNTLFTDFGLFGLELKQGYLRSTRGKREQPNPCEHLDNKGAINFYGGGQNPSGNLKSWDPIISGQKAYLSQSTNSSEVVVYTGFTSPYGVRKFWKRDGNVGTNNTLPYYYPLKFGWCAPWDSARSSLGTRTPMQHGQHLFITQVPYLISQKWLEVQYSVAYKDHRTLRSTGLYASLLTGTAGPFGGYELYESDISITFVRGNTDGSFSLLLHTAWTKTSYYVDAYGREGNHVVTTGVADDEKNIFIVSPSSVPLSGSFNFDSLEKELYNYEKVALSEFSKDEATYARCAAVQNTSGLEANNLENIAGLKGSFSGLADLVKAYKAFKHGDVKACMKALSGVYLWYMFAVAPTASDVKDVTKNTSRLIGEISKHRFSNERRRGKFITDRSKNAGILAYYAEYHLRLQDKVYAVIWNALCKFGFEPTSSQIWALMPWSFVVDWFLPIGKTLEQIDAYNTMCTTYDIIHRIETYRASLIVQVKASPYPNLYEFIGPYEQSYYRRLILSGPGLLDPLGTPMPTGLSTTQVLLSGALLTQKLR